MSKNRFFISRYNYTSAISAIHEPETLEDLDIKYDSYYLQQIQENLIKENFDYSEDLRIWIK